MMVRYSDLAAPLTRMVASFPSGFDVNIGNVPHCVVKAIAPFVHHGGERTWTITANDHGAPELGAGRKKYVLKQAFKTKPEGCRSCVFDDRCSGVFDAYAERFGTSELVPVRADDPLIDPPGPSPIPRTVAARLSRLRARAPFGELAWTRTDAIAGGVEMTLISPSGERIVAFCTETPEGPRTGYRLIEQAPSTSSPKVPSTSSPKAPSAALVDGLRRLLVAMGRLPEAAITSVAVEGSSAR